MAAAAPEPCIREATAPADVAIAGMLFREYASTLPFSLCFQGFDEELAKLPGKYARPNGCILLAWKGAEPVGCVALRPIASLPHDPPRVCELKRLYVRPAGRGQGLGRALCDRVIAEARKVGYQRMKLDSEPDMTAAMATYRSLGFAPTPRYNDDPHPQTVFMALDL